MNIVDAEKTAAKLFGTQTCFPFRNVWGFFPDPDTDIQAIFITKDGVNTDVKGIFLDKGLQGEFEEYNTGKVVHMNAVFGKTFFDDDPTLRIDPDPEDTSIDRIEKLLEESADLLVEHGLPPMALVMLHDLADNTTDNSVAKMRLLILKNYLLKTDEFITVEEFSFMHHELFTI